MVAYDCSGRLFTVSLLKSSDRKVIAYDCSGWTIHRLTCRLRTPRRLRTRRRPRRNRSNKRLLELRQAFECDPFECKRCGKRANTIRGRGPHLKFAVALVKLENASLEFFARPLLVQLDLYLRRRMKK